MLNLTKVRWQPLLFSALLFISSILTVVSCTPQETTTNSVGGKALSVGFVPWVGYAGHYVASAKGFFASEGVTVKDIPFTADSDSNASFLAKRIDLNWIGLPTMLAYTDRGPDTKIIFQSDYSNGADGIVGRNIKSKEALKGQKIARENTLFVEAEIERYLEKMGVPRSDITPVDFSATEAAEAFVKGKVNLAVTYEPSLSKAAKEGKGEIVFSTKDTNIVPDGLVTRDEIIKNYKPELIAYLRAIDKAVKLIKEKPDEVVGIIAKALELKPEEVAGQFALIKLYDVKMNKDISFKSGNPDSLLESLNFSAKVGKNLKLVPSNLDTKSILSDEIVQGT